MTDHDAVPLSRAAQRLNEKLEGALSEIDAFSRERHDGPIRAARLKLAAVYGAKRLRRRLDLTEAEAA